MLITTKVDYAIKCVLHLSIDQFGYISVTNLSKKLIIPKHYLAKILQALVKSGIAESQQGKQGGFKLRKKPEEISMWDVFVSLNALPVIYKCVGENFTCKNEKVCSTKPVWVELGDYVVERLKNTQFGDLGKKQFNSMQSAIFTKSDFLNSPGPKSEEKKKGKVLPIKLKN